MRLASKGEIRIISLGTQSGDHLYNKTDPDDCKSEPRKMLDGNRIRRPT